MGTLPPEVTFGRVTGTINLMVTDTPDDADSVPDLLAVTGTVNFRASASLLISDSAKTVILPQSLNYSVTAGKITDTDGNPWVDLVASDSPGLDPTGFTWTATFALNGGVSLAPITFLLPHDSVLDITEMVPVPASGGTSTTRGPAGPSAYDVAVQDGFVGTREEWLAGLEGAPGPSGIQGLSAYQVAVAQGFVGTEAAWVASLKVNGTTVNNTDNGDGTGTVVITPSTGTTVSNTDNGNGTGTLTIAS